MLPVWEGQLDQYVKPLNQTWANANSNISGTWREIQSHFIGTMAVTVTRSYYQSMILWLRPITLLLQNIKGKKGVPEVFSHFIGIELF